MTPRATRVVLGVDPGDRHVGLALWTDAVDTVTCEEVDAPAAMREISKRILRHGVTVIVIESFSLYADKAAAQTGSSMGTAQLIGQIKYVAEQHGIEVVMQGASIKTPTRAQCKARGVVIKSKSAHARDAGLHAAYYVLKNGIGLGRNTGQAGSAGTARAVE